MGRSGWNGGHRHHTPGRRGRAQQSGRDRPSHLERSGRGVNQAESRTGTPPSSAPGQNDSAALHFAALAALIAGGLSLGTAGLVPLPVCLLTLVLILIMGLAVPRWTPRFRHDSPQRTLLALAVLGLLVAVTAGSGPGALFSGQLSGALSTAVSELSLPAGVPIGLLAVALELAERRGVQSALVLGIAVLGLASVAAPGWHLLPGVLLGWPATLFALTKLAGPANLAGRSSKSGAVVGSPNPVRGTDDRPGRPSTTRRPTSMRGPRLAGRWQVLPILSAITLSLAALALMILTGGTSAAPQAGGWDAGRSATGASGNRSTSDYLGGEM